MSGCPEASGVEAQSTLRTPETSGQGSTIFKTEPYFLNRSISSSNIRIYFLV